MTKYNIVLLALGALALAEIGSAISVSRIRPVPREETNYDDDFDFGMEDIISKNIIQRVDHFNVQSAATFEQQYFEHSANYSEGGPIFVIVGGEEFVYYPFQLNRSLALHLAREEGGAAFHLEQRYYGYSQPADDLSTENMRFLTVDQALADIAHFITHIKTSLPGASESKVIVVGREFGGSLALWFRQSYPHLADGAYVAGAPVLGKLNHFEFNELIGENMLTSIGQQCYDEVRQAFSELDVIAEKAIQSGDYEHLNTVLTTCNDSRIEGPAEVTMKVRWLSTVLSSSVSYGPEAENVCALLQVRNETIQTALEGLVAYVTEYSYDGCFMTYQYADYVKNMRLTSLNSTYTRYGDRQALYEQCTQVGWFPTTDSDRQPFGRMIPLAFYTQLCSDVFGADVIANAADNVKRFNVVRGGLRPRVSHVLFTNAELNPQRALMVREAIGHEVVFRQLANSDWSTDFYEPRFYDSEELAELKRQNMETLRSWL